MARKSAFPHRVPLAALCSAMLTGCASAPRYPASFSPQQIALSEYATVRLQVVRKQMHERLRAEEKDRLHQNALTYRKLASQDSSWLRVREATAKARLEEQRWLALEAEVLQSVAFSREISDFNYSSRFSVSSQMLKWSNWATQFNLPAARDAALAEVGYAEDRKSLAPDAARRQALAVGVAWTRAMEARHAFVSIADRALATHGHPSLAEQYVNARVAQERVREIQRQNDRAASSQAQVKWIMGLAAYVGLSLAESALWNKPTVSQEDKDGWLKEMAERRARKKADCRQRGMSYQEGSFSFDEGYCY